MSGYNTWDVKIGICLDRRGKNWIQVQLNKVVGSIIGGQVEIICNRCHLEMFNKMKNNIATDKEYD